MISIVFLLKSLFSLSVGLYLRFDRQLSQALDLNNSSISIYERRYNTTRHQLKMKTDF